MGYECYYKCASLDEFSFISKVFILLYCHFALTVCKSINVENLVIYFKKFFCKNFAIKGNREEKKFFAKLS